MKIGYAILLDVVLIVMNLVMWFTVGSGVSLLAAGFIAGLLVALVTEWYVDRKVNKEIMDEINALSRNYYHPTLFNQDFSQNNNEVTTNDNR